MKYHCSFLFLLYYNNTCNTRSRKLSVVDKNDGDEFELLRRLCLKRTSMVKGRVKTGQWKEG